MGLFSKKEEEKKESVPALPELPKLPSLPRMEIQEEILPQLPSFPKNNIGEKLSQNTIKEAVRGEKEEEIEVPEEDDFSYRENQMIRRTPRKEPAQYTMPLKLSVRKEIPEGFEDAGKKIMELEPIFVRIDRFEESRRIFEKTKEQISSIERALNKIKAIKQEEDKELSQWEQEILNIKDKISKVERDIFSKTE